MNQGTVGEQTANALMMGHTKWAVVNSKDAARIGDKTRTDEAQKEVTNQEN